MLPGMRIFPALGLSRLMRKPRLLPDPSKQERGTFASEGSEDGFGADAGGHGLEDAQTDERGDEVRVHHRAGLEAQLIDNALPAQRARVRLPPCHVRLQPLARQDPRALRERVPSLVTPLHRRDLTQQSDRPESLPCVPCASGPFIDVIQLPSNIANLHLLYAKLTTSVKAEGCNKSSAKKQAGHSGQTFLAYLPKSRIWSIFLPFFLQGLSMRLRSRMVLMPYRVMSGPLRSHAVGDIVTQIVSDKKDMQHVMQRMCLVQETLASCTATLNHL